MYRITKTLIQVFIVLYFDKLAVKVPMDIKFRYILFPDAFHRCFPLAFSYSYLKKDKFLYLIIELWIKYHDRQMHFGSEKICICV